ncbi:hypothetical protein BS47DRAFT_1449955 [Hydnum rufescens UP504]|uniref:Uncharacterized protein n=1 Tax=Hydnum rufescens UP504 TaxID=1448309 RepID=A0A9P6DMC4_9AGAM|nr:hypothetical protein BS47DRAFT_1449955 [Hydnum rufescens UP504]
MTYATWGRSSERPRVNKSGVHEKKGEEVHVAPATPTIACENRGHRSVGVFFSEDPAMTVERGSPGWPSEEGSGGSNVTSATWKMNSEAVEGPPASWEWYEFGVSKQGRKGIGISLPMARKTGKSSLLRASIGCPSEFLPRQNGRSQSTPDVGGWSTASSVNFDAACSGRHMLVWVFFSADAATAPGILLCHIGSRGHARLDFGECCYSWMNSEASGNRLTCCTHPYSRKTTNSWATNALLVPAPEFKKISGHVLCILVP